VAVRNLVQLAERTGDSRYLGYARETLEIFAPQIEDSPAGLADLVLALGEYLASPHVAAAGPAAEAAPAHADEPLPAPAAPAAAPSDAPESDAAVEDSQGIVHASAESPRVKPDEPPIVTAKAFLDVDKLPVGGTCRIVVFLEIAEGWHINANPAQPANLIPTKFTIESQAGTKLQDVKYPAGAKLQVEGIDEPLLVYEKRAVIRGVLVAPRAAEAAADVAADEIELRVRYQPCDDRQCLAPRTLKLAGRVPLAKAGEAVKAINQNLFPQPDQEKPGPPRERGGVPGRGQ
ncbi:MAG TPA: protein-disulfide reductase DsbD domain-containing protein, partial [Planctomycetaceae bacterium]|nr:protein-disulfide reductase DsbD domain-containing protein [Planctomycetaceae bacterium]